MPWGLGCLHGVPWGDSDSSCVWLCMQAGACISTYLAHVSVYRHVRPYKHECACVSVCVLHVTVYIAKAAYVYRLVTQVCFYEKFLCTAMCLCI